MIGPGPDPEAWRAWAEKAPEWAFQFFAGGRGRYPLQELADRHGPAGALEELEELARDHGTRVTIIFEPEGEY